MTLTFPRDMVSALCWEAADFKLVWRQEISRSAAGTQGRDLGPALWHATFESYPMPDHEAEGLLTDFETLRGVLRTFYAVPMRRKRPAKYRYGDLGLASVHSVRADRSAIRIDGLPPGLELLAGDFVSVLTSIGGRELLRFATGGTVFSTGLSPWLEVAPHIRPSVQVGDFAKINLPFVEMRLEPGSLDDPRHSLRRKRVRFSATQIVR